MCERISSRKSVYWWMNAIALGYREKGIPPFDGYSVCQTLISVSVFCKKCKS